MLSEEGQHGRTVHVIFESRGRKEDRELELEFRRIAASAGPGRQDFGCSIFSRCSCPRRRTPSACNSRTWRRRPIALSHLRPDQPNRAFEIARPKIGGLAQLP